jgi:hypothetical protein
MWFIGEAVLHIPWNETHGVGQRLQKIVSCKHNCSCVPREACVYCHVSGFEGLLKLMSPPTPITSALLAQRPAVFVLAVGFENLFLRPTPETMSALIVLLNYSHAERTENTELEHSTRAARERAWSVLEALFISAVTCFIESAQLNTLDVSCSVVVCTPFVPHSHDTWAGVYFATFGPNTPALHDRCAAMLQELSLRLEELLRFKFQKTRISIHAMSFSKVSLERDTTGDPSCIDSYIDRFHWVAKAIVNLCQSTQAFAFNRD